MEFINRVPKWDFSGLLGNASALSVEDLEKEYGKLVCENEKILAGYVLG